MCYLVAETFCRSVVARSHGWSLLILSFRSTHNAFIHLASADPTPVTVRPSVAGTAGHPCQPQYYRWTDGRITTDNELLAARRRYSLDDLSSRALPCSNIQLHGRLLGYVNHWLVLFYYGQFCYRWLCISNAKMSHGRLFCRNKQLYCLENAAYTNSHNKNKNNNKNSSNNNNS